MKMTNKPGGRLAAGIAAALVLALSAGPVLAAQPAARGSTPGLGWGAGGSKGAPFPIAGAGLPALALAGLAGWRAVKRRRDDREG